VDLPSGEVQEGEEGVGGGEDLREGGREGERRGERYDGRSRRVRRALAAVKT